MKRKLFAAAVVLALGAMPSAFAVTIQDTFTGGASTYNWKPFNGACLTAGNGTGKIPACVGLPYYGGEQLVGGTSGTLPDTAGSGALRFTNGYPGGYSQNGALVSNFTFPTNEGLQVTFTTVTYRGDSGGAAGDGADGISFYLMDGASAPGIGAWGGSLGYTCSNANTPFDGLVGAYLGLGIDEYGNFLNQGDNTASGYNYVPGRIGLRGAGSISWAALNSPIYNPSYSSYYPATLSAANKLAAVRNTCSTGFYWDYSNASSPRQSTHPAMDYPTIPNAYKVLSGVTIANEAATKRGSAVPITYNLKITQDGLLSFQYSYNGGAYQQVITNQSITASNGALPSSFRFGFAGSTGGSSNIHEVLCFKATPAELANSSAGLNEKQTAKVQTGTQVYFAFYNPNNWSGSLTSQNLLYDPVAKTLNIATAANWDASCVLTGVAAGKTCPASGVAGPTAAQGPTQRSILSWNGTAGIPFEWANLASADKTALTQGETSSANRLNYLRGDRSNEVNSLGVGLYRVRASVLGDIIDSSPTWVGPPSAPYPANWSDFLNSGASFPENAGPSYAQFVSASKSRLNIVYGGANDGLLHGFRSGAFDSSGNYVTSSATPNDGLEVLAYMPRAVVDAIHSSTDPTVDFSSTLYGHNFFVDAPPGSGDLYYRGAWHTWLVGGLGPGGAAIYALDVTDPSRFAETNAGSLVIGEWTPSTISCVGNGGCGNNLGKTFGVPQIRRLHNGSWGIIFGNGFSSSSGDAGIFVITVDPGNGSMNSYYLSAGKSGTADGIAYTTPADLDADHVTDYVYAGDLKGNVWRFDLTSSNPTNWGVVPTLIFTTPSGQPITTQLQVAATATSASGNTRVMVDFGTGRQIPVTNAAPTTYASGAQSLYGIWDWNLADWNSKSTTPYASLTGPITISTAMLQTQTIQGSYVSTGGNNYRTVSNSKVCWRGSNSCTSGNVQLGWQLILPASSEQVIYSPILQLGSFIVNTTIPAGTSILTCGATTATGWTMAIDPASGGAFKNSFFGDSLGNFVSINGQIVSGEALNGTGSPSIVSTAGGSFLVTQTVSGTGAVAPINPPAGNKGSRLTWIQRR
jgi:type IV pilus assembly protein PilY1